MVFCNIIYRFWGTVKDDATMSVFEEPTHHVRTHTTQANHAKLRRSFLIHVRNRSFDAISKNAASYAVITAASLLMRLG
jgi:hypothetical protein